MSWLLLFFFFSLLAVGFLVGSVGIAQAADEVVLVTPVQNDAPTLSPNHAAQRGGGYVAFSNLFSTLLILDWGVTTGTTHYGDLAQSWEIDESGLVYTFRLHENALWHDGQPLTSEDVKYTYETITEKGYPFSAFLKDVTEIRTPDDHTLVIELGQPNAAFLPQLAQAGNWYGAIMPKHIWEGVEWDSGPNLDNPIGSGPFRFVEWVKGSHIVLEANDDFYLGRPQIDTLILRVMPDTTVAQAEFRAGNLTWLPSQYAPEFGELELWRSDPEVVVVETGSHYNYDLWMNVQREPFNDPLVREAIAFAMNRQEQQILGFHNTWKAHRFVGLPASSFTDQDVQFPEFDPDRAETLLDEAGYPRGADGWRFEAAIVEPGFSTLPAWMEVLVKQLRDVGINARWELSEHGSWGQKMEDSNFDMTIYYTRYGPDPAAYAEHFATDCPRCFHGYSNPALDALAEQAQLITDIDERTQLYGQIQRMILEDMPIITLFNENKITIVRRGWEGFATQASGFNTALGWSSFFAVSPPGSE